DAIGIADRDHPVADARLGAVAPLDERQFLAVDLEERQIRSFVATDDSRGIFMAVGGGDGDGIDRSGAGEPLDQMVVGDDVAVGRNDEARAQRAGFARTRLGASAGTAAALITL